MALSPAGTYIVKRHGGIVKIELVLYDKLVIQALQLMYVH